jgi:arylsulfatase A-like enzyme
VTRPPPPTRSARQILEATLVAAVLLGAAETALRLGLVSGVFHRQVWGGAELGWLAPLGYLALMAPFAAALALWARVDGGRRSWPVTIAGLAFTATVSLLLLVPGLHGAARVGLAAGVAAVALRLEPRFRSVMAPLVRRSAPRLAAITICYGIATGWWPRFAEGRAAGAVPSVARADLSNLLLIVWDTVRQLSTGLGGYHRPTTPNLDRLAERGVVFERAWSTAPWTLPAHGSLLTGLLPQEFPSSPLDPIPPGLATLPAVLASHGYLTAGFVANTRYAGRRFGVGRDFAVFEDYRPSIGLWLGSAAPLRAVLGARWVRRLLGRYQKADLVRASRINERFLGWLDRRPPNRPFFALVNYFDAHDPYLPPPPFDTLFGADPGREVTDEFGWTGIEQTARQTDLEQRSYDAAIRYLDQVTADLLGALDRRGLLDGTIVIVTSDHGEQFGERGLLYHSNSFFPEVLRVPLVVAHPRLTPSRVPTNVSLRDLPATVLDLAGLPPALPGRSLRSLWNVAAPPLWTDPILAGTIDQARRSSHAVIREDGYYVDWQGREAFYRPDLDPGLLANRLALGDTLPTAVRSARDSLRALSAGLRWP